MPGGTGEAEQRPSAGRSKRPSKPETKPPRAESTGGEEDDQLGALDVGTPRQSLWRRPVERARRRKRSDLGNMFNEQLEYQPEEQKRTTTHADGRQGNHKLSSTKSFSRYLSRMRRVDDAGAVSQSTGGAGGSTGNARMLDPTHPSHKVLLYRLVSLPDPENPWGDGLLLTAARKHEDDDSLFFALGALLRQRWCDDPVLAKLHAEHARAHGHRTTDQRNTLRETSRANNKNRCSLRQLDTKHKRGSTHSTAEGDQASRQTGWTLPHSDDTWGHVLVHARGTVGETALHLLFLLHSTPHRRLAKLLVPLLATQRTPDMDGTEVSVLDAAYIGQPYHGEVCLHFAIVHNDLEMVRLLVENGADCQSPHASGDFFYEHRALYFGGTCLGFAACLDQKETVTYLLTNQYCKADVNSRDHGPFSQKTTFHPSMCLDNTVLHCLVLHDREEMYRLLVDEHGANPWAPNGNGDTPLLLACRRSLNMAQVAMTASRQLVWSYASVSCVRYPLYELEGEGFGNTMKHLRTSFSEASHSRHTSPAAGGPSAKTHASKASKSVLSVVSRERVTSLLYSEVLWKLINDKWIVFGRRRFFWFTIISMLAIVLLTLSLCQEDPNTGKCKGILVLFFFPIPITIDNETADKVFAASLGFDCFLLLRLLYCLVRLDMLRDSNALMRNAAGLLSYTLPWIAWGLKNISPGGTIYRWVCGFSAFMGWIHFMKVTFSFESGLGPMVLMVEEMLKSDMTTFVLIYAAYMHAFSGSLLGIFSGIKRDSPSGIAVYNRMMRYTVNPDLPDQIDRLSTPAGDELGFYGELLESESNVDHMLMYSYWWIEYLWALVSNVVLLNLLIAMMSNRYMLIMENAEAQWRLQFADLVLLQEATPWWFVPIPNAMPWSDKPQRRPRHHVTGKLNIIDEDGKSVEIDCWFLLMEVVQGEKENEEDDDGNHPLFGVGGGRNERDMEKEQTALLKQLAARLEKVEDKLDRQTKLIKGRDGGGPTHGGRGGAAVHGAPTVPTQFKATDGVAALAAELGGASSTIPKEMQRLNWSDLLSHMHVANVKDAGFLEVVKKAKKAANVERRQTARNLLRAAEEEQAAKAEFPRAAQDGAHQLSDELRAMGYGAAPSPEDEEPPPASSGPSHPPPRQQNNWNVHGPPQLRTVDDMAPSLAGKLILEGAMRRCAAWADLEA